MKKEIVFLLAFVLFVREAMAISSTIGDSYASKETIIAQFSEDILSVISSEQVGLLREGHIDTAFEFGVKKIQNRNWIWLIAPQGAGNYTLRVSDIVANVNGVPEVVNYEKIFSVGGTSVDYSIKPGAILTSSDFEITAMLYEDFSKSVGVSFPTNREVVLYPGENKIKFSLVGLFGTQLAMINFGRYTFPAYISRPNSVCGDGLISGTEICDGDELGGQNCMSVNSSYIGGNLSCASNCLSFVTSACLMDNATSSSNSGNSFEECSPSRLDLCLTDKTCTDSNGFWYDDRCNLLEKGAVCDTQHRALCLNPEQCMSADGFWYDDFCNENASVEKITFEFSPNEIISKVLVSDPQKKYSFRIINAGDRIENIKLNYNKAKFNVTPEENISIDSNGSVLFSLELKNELNGEVKGAIAAYVGEKVEYLLITITPTNNVSDVKTSYGRSSGRGYKCSEQLNGNICSSSERCSTTVVETLDTNYCCVGVCETISSGSGNRSWIGYLIGGIIIVGGLIIFLKYRSTGKTGNAVKQGFARAERNLP